MRRGWSCLALLFFLTLCANARQNPVAKRERIASVPGGKLPMKVDLQAYLSRLFGKMLFTHKGCSSISIPSDSLFEPHSDNVKPANWAAPIGTVAAICKRYPETNVTVSTYTDCLHSEEQNIALSESQASMIKQALVDKGIASRKITAEGWGESRPVASNATEEGRKANRRILIIFCPPKGPCAPPNLKKSAGKRFARDSASPQLDSTSTQAVVHLSKPPKAP